MEPSSPPGRSSPQLDDVLTPRTKVAKMLADIDAAPTPSPPQVQPSDATRADSPSISARPAGDRIGPFEEQSEADSDDSNDIRRPQGRAARRMLGQLKSSPPVHAQPDAAHESGDELYSTTPLAATRRHTISPVRSPLSDRQSNGLFASPAKSADDDSENELPTNPVGRMRKLDLVAQHREKRLAGKAGADEVRNATSSDSPDEAFDNSQDTPADLEVEKIMSDASRPARKASKKALLEMERETQRMARQQALAHQMRVKKKFTTSDLFAKFNFRKTGTNEGLAKQPAAAAQTTSSSAPSSDGPEERSKEPVSTPPTSPPTPLDRQKALVERGALSKLQPVRQDSLTALTEVDDDEELPDLAEIMRSSQMPNATLEPVRVEYQNETKGLKLARLGKKAALPKTTDSDDELDILPALPHHLRMFDNAVGSKRGSRPAESKAIHNLKHLSHIHNRDAQPQKKGTRPSLNPTALELQLRRRAKEQARMEQLERIEELKAKGIDVQTGEEREREAEAFENLLEKARQDAVALRKAERAAVKEAGGEGAVEISDDEDEDEDYLGSGSEDEGREEAEHEEDDEATGLVDDAANETGEDEDEDLEAGSEGEGEEAAVDERYPGEEPVDIAENDDESHRAGSSTPAQVVRKGRKSRIVVDEDDENDQNDQNIAQGEAMDGTTAEESQESQDPFAAFGFGAANPTALMSPTQAFNATMQTPSQATQEGKFGRFQREAPPSTVSLPPTLPDFDTQDDDDTQSGFVAGSQVPESQRVSLNWETQMPETPATAGMTRDASSLWETPGWEPTQDQGLISPWDVVPKINREDTLDSMADHDTQSTVRLRVSESPAPSQHAPRRGRLGRRRIVQADDSDDDSPTVPTSIRPEKKDAFREMAERRRKALTAVEKADVDKEMRQMMDEAAEESEDEYAGLGGDDFVAPETEQDREMIDSSHVEVDERAIAAHFAEKQRLREEEETSKLYKDLTTGMMRRNRAANAFDLDEDEGEIALRRRQMRQQEEAKKRRALLKDENIASLADGKRSKGKEAFLKAIADDDGGDDLLDVGDDDEDTGPATQDDSTQSQSQQAASGALQETSGNKRKAGEGPENVERPPVKQRRTEASAFKKPTSLLEVKESVSFLLEESHGGTTVGPSVLDIGSDSENEYGEADFGEDDDDAEVEAEQSRQNDGGFAPNTASFDAKAMPPPRLPASQRRTAAPAKPAVVDRLSLKRGASSGSDSAHSRTAWAANPSSGGFKVPSLLRRATTNTTSMANDRGVSTPNLSRENSGVKMGGSKKSSLAYQARAEERKAIVEASTKRREENTARIAQMRRNSNALSRGLAGRFE
ncbi:uncharacterized protein LTR77_009540 [Saxophila tyrrhenica]|uniref:DNA replication checkpoint mediator MRC1 domain-containing protein n=1 Tax=Saxophila tyrrhenica TaxID=1690608 RepID=A0AAV9NZR8_9PEZI|nr:hypothetical protein LTR77_009540 [Saxophila tyrrhenica]